MGDRCVHADAYTDGHTRTRRRKKKSNEGGKLALVGVAQKVARLSCKFGAAATAGAVSNANTQAEKKREGERERETIPPYSKVALSRLLP